MTLGIDVYEKYNQVTSWPQLWADGVRDCYVKGTNSTAKANPTADAYVAGARGVGMAVGLYAYVLGSATPQAQADAFAAEILRLATTGLPPALDYEDSTLPTGAAARAWIIAFFIELKAKTGLVEFMLYSSGSMLSSEQAQSISIPGITIRIWDAEYGVNDGGEHPVTHYSGKIDIHQFTSTGHLAGITGNVDLDDFETPLGGSMTGPVQIDPNQMLTGYNANGSSKPESLGNLLGLIEALYQNISAQGGWLPSELTGIKADIAALATTVAALQDAVGKLAQPAATVTPTKLTGTVTMPVEVDLS